MSDDRKGTAVPEGVHMNHTISYRPYRCHAWFVPFVFGFGIIYIFTAGCLLSHTNFVFLVPLGIGIVCFLLAKVLYDTSNILVLLEPEGLRMTGGRYGNYRYVLWRELPYAYYTRSSRGHMFLVLSPEPLCPKQVKSWVKRGANSSKVCFDSVVVIPINTMQDISLLKETVASKVLHVNQV